MSLMWIHWRRNLTFLQLRKNAILAFQDVVGGLNNVPVANKVPDEELCTGLVIHGLLGAGRNWRTISQSLVTRAAEHSKKNWKLKLVDLRNHGSSASISGFLPPHDIQSTAQDLINLYSLSNKWPMIVLGHSLGGKVALEYLRLLCELADYKHKLPKEVWILDSQLGPISSNLESSSKVDEVFKTIQSVSLPIASRKWLYHYVRAEQGLSLEVAHWLGSNLVGHPTGPLNWIFNVHGAAEMYSSYKNLDCWKIVKDPPDGTVLNIVRAENSDRWNKDLIHELYTNIQTPKAKIHVLGNCGHWLHADNPDGLINLILPSIIKL